MMSHLPDEPFAAFPYLTPSLANNDSEGPF
jgi:hypothetical protein